MKVGNLQSAIVSSTNYDVTHYRVSTVLITFNSANSFSAFKSEKL